ncbi:MAG: VTT domain-containing protein [Xenococcaceae cyanobacterium MO_234.B1]|nr:VTT domain-containing protein [Xenococcaceae cyanobacterium MO_234.B1]
MPNRTGIRQRELCDLLGLDYKAVAASAKQLGLSTHAYIQQETGWILKDELYYPPDTLVIDLATQAPPKSTKSSSQPKRWVDILGLFGLGIVVGLAIALVKQVGIEQIRANVTQLGFWAPCVLLLLRSVSIVIPAIPSTAYSVLAGTLFGFWQGIALIAIADFAACSGNFYLAKRYGRGIVQRLVGQRFMGQVDSGASNYLENNPFLVTGFLMTGLFDFVSYAVGLTQMQWRKFLPALILGIIISTPPIVALGAGIFTGGKWLLGFALLGMFALAFLAGWLNRRHNQKRGTPL